VSTARGSLAGRRVVVTRAEEDARALAEEIEGLGAEAVVLPAIRIAPPADGGPLAAAARNARSFDWVVFTSRNAVERFLAAVANARREGNPLEGVKLAAVGPATAGALARAGRSADLVAKVHVGDALAEELVCALGTGRRRVLLPRAAIARDVIPDALSRAGHDVTVVTAYETQGADRERASELGADLARGSVDAVLFFSSSAVDAVVESLGDHARERLACTALVSIGPATSRAIAAHGLSPAREADPHTTAGVVAALVALLGR
jgi:uroporphyrinogen III methyltransferase/synthase